MDLDRKVPYEPAIDKRFKISDDPITSERRTALLKTVRYLKDTTPFFAGMTVFGSFTKGKVLDEESAKHTDVDYVLFLDRELYEKKIQTYLTENPEARLWIESRMKSHPVRFGGTDEYKINLESAAGEYLVKIASEQIASYKPARLTLELVSGIRAEYINKVGTESLIDTLLADDYILSVMKMTETDREELLRQFALPFFFEIGNGLYPFRTALLEALSKLPSSERDRLWSKVHEASILWERQRNIPGSLEESFPRTFDDACRYYKVKSPQ